MEPSRQQDFQEEGKRRQSGGCLLYTSYYARLLNSAAFLADAWHHRSDALSSVGSLLGIGGAMLGFPVLDAVASVVICLFILKVAFDVLKDSVKKMLDTSCGDFYEKKLSDFILMQQEVLGIDMLHTRMFGNRVYADLEIRVDGNKSLREACLLYTSLETDRFLAFFRVLW